LAHHKPSEDVAYWLDVAAQSAAVYRTGTYADIFVERLRDIERSLIPLKFMVPTVMAAFLLGAVVGQLRILHEPQRHRRLLGWLVGLALPVGLACSVLYTWSLESSPRSVPSWDTVGGYILFVVGVPFQSIGYAAALVLFLQTETGRWLLRPLAAVGRMALTNYLTHTLVCTTLFYGYGFGLFGQVQPWQGLLLALVIYGLQIPLSNVWLRYFRFGPFEWVWRSLTYGQAQPMWRGETRSSI
jgi:uncharacterized protein